MLLQWTFLGSFLLGLILAVRYMIVGVERSPGPASAGGPSTAGAPATPRARVVLPAIAGAAIAFGLAGYLLTRFTAWGPVARVTLAAAAGALGAAAAMALILRWAVATPLEEVDERFVLMGHLARVTRAIGDTPGEIEYEVDGVRHTARAISLEGDPVAADTEVVIERVENGVAYVEPWLEVEKRI